MSEFIPGKTYIPASGQPISDDDVQALIEVANGRWYTEYKHCKKFADALSKKVGKENCVLTNSGSSASLLAINAASKHYQGCGKYVITCATAFPTTVAPIIQSGLIPVFVDIDPVTLDPDYVGIKNALKHYKDEVMGIILTHTMGYPYDERFVRSLTGECTFLISDACDALGATLDEGFPVGYYSDAVTLSFFPAHHITSIEGGAVLTDSLSIYEIARSLSSWGRSCYCLPGQSNTCGHRFDWDDIGSLPEGYDHKYVFDYLGYNLKMDEFRAALGYSQLQRFEEFKRIRIENWLRLCEGISSVPNLEVVYPVQEGFSPFGFPIYVYDTPKDCVNLIDHLEQHKIATRRLFAGNIVRQPMMENEKFEVVGTLRGSDDVMNQMFWIGCGPTLTTEMIDYMIDTIINFYAKKN